MILSRQSIALLLTTKKQRNKTPHMS